MSYFRIIFANSIVVFIFGLLIYSAALAEPVNTESEDISHDFRGKIIYDGYVEGTDTIPGRQSRNFSLGGLINQALNTKTNEVKASLHMEIEFEGNIIRGSYRQQGYVNGIGTFTGTRNGNICRTVDISGARFLLKCTLLAISYDINEKNRKGGLYKARAEAVRTSYIDYSERGRQLDISSKPPPKQLAESSNYASGSDKKILMSKQARAILMTSR